MTATLDTVERAALGLPAEARKPAAAKTCLRTLIGCSDDRRRI